MTGDNALLRPQIPDEDKTPDVLQRRASDPAASVWVGASAGTGKTKVLTDRVLRLLLPRSATEKGTDPHRILCLTFTKAAANEMALRINKTLSEWAVMPDEKLIAELTKLTGAPPAPHDMEAARKLFAAVVDTPGGLKIMTIHSFCQSVLTRFPLEAGLPPHFKVSEEGLAKEILLRARDIILHQARQEPDSDKAKALDRMAAAQNEEQFNETLSAICGERAQLHKIFNKNENIHGALCALLGVNEADSEEILLQQSCSNESFDVSGLYAACRALSEGTDKTDQPRGAAIQNWLDQTPELRLSALDDYYSCYFTTTGDIRSALMTKGLGARYPAELEALKEEALRLSNLRGRIAAVKCARLTTDILELGRDIIALYQKTKHDRALLDYDDLIIKTRELLTGRTTPAWVLFKLDGGIDHVLIDEAQDTNPEQWEIIEALCGDFFSGAGAHDDTLRTVFTVGDDKQSIYSFQRAAPDEFARMKEHFRQKIENAELLWRDEALHTSFRSTKTVLRLVDEVFAPEDVRNGLGINVEEHESHRKGQEGIVELWPLFESPDADKPEPWTPPTQIIERPSGAAMLADQIGNTVKEWLDSGEELKSRGRKIRPGDIMVLVRTRTAFLDQLVRAMKSRNIPVSGVDRMVLGDQLAVQDLLALAQFSLLPEDDLTLACILKSPFVGWNDDRLMEACQPRSGSLWVALTKSEEEDVKTIVKWLRQFIGFAAEDHPYEFFSRALQRPCPANGRGGMVAMLGRLGQDALDPVDEFLGAALNYERDHMPTLQGFLIWQKKEDISIKREMEEAGGNVRIMTVHGSKGLQAPIVFLPDTILTGASRRPERLLWPDKTGLDLPLWSPGADVVPQLFEQARSSVYDKLDQEYRRLLYVALTRAEDRLYIAGHTGGKRSPAEGSWYNLVKNALEREDNPLKSENLAFGEDKELLRISDPQTKDPDKKDKKNAEEEEKDYGTPEWLFKPPPQEPVPPHPLIPSRPSEPEPGVRSPLSRGDEYRFKRGNITHTLLQFLPDLPADKRRHAATDFVAKPGFELNEATQQSIVAETMKILENPEFAPLFGDGSMAEVPITGLSGTQLVSGQIDRLLVTDTEVHIVDYKTNRPPPTDPKDVPAQYVRQLRAYYQTIKGIYPEHTIKCYLFWTDTADLMKIDI